MPIQLGIVHGFMGGAQGQCFGDQVKLTLTGSMLTFIAFPTNIAPPVPEGLVDGDTATRGFHTDAGSGVVLPEVTRLIIDFGAGNEQAVTRARMYGGTLDTWRIEYGSDGTNWETAFDGFYVGSSMAWTDDDWECVGAYRYWSFVKTDVAVTTGLFTTELELFGLQ